MLIKNVCLRRPLSLSNSTHEALEEALQGLERLYGKRLVKVVLFGSHARGDAHPESDVDLLVVLKGAFRLYDEVKRTSPLVMDILLKYGLPLSLLHFSEQQYQDPLHPLMMNVHREGVTL
jgi:predicted nucleotidyltransferase